MILCLQRDTFQMQTLEQPNQNNNFVRFQISITKNPQQKSLQIRVIAKLFVKGLVKQQLKKLVNKF